MTGSSAREANQTAAARLVPGRPTILKPRAAAAGCKACELWRLGTQSVFGEGPRDAEIMLVGEQPGDLEDREGRPFVGPAGRLLDRSLEEAGLKREEVYLTNVVKHFRWAAQGGKKKRIHRKPGLVHVEACRPWLDAELSAVRPRVLVCLGRPPPRRW